MSFTLTINARIWWKSTQLKYNVDEMTWAQFTDEFNDQFFNANITRAHWDQLDNLQQGDMTVIEVDSLIAATTDQKKVRWLIRAFCSNIMVHVDDGIYPPPNIKECYRVVLQAKYHLKGTQPLPSTQSQTKPQMDTTSGQNPNKQSQNSNWKNNKNKRNFQGQSQEGQGNKQGDNSQSNKQAKHVQCNMYGKFHWVVQSRLQCLLFLWPGGLYSEELSQ